MSSAVWGAAAGVVAVAGLALAGLRWLRVAQREHYLPGSASLFARRWWSARPWSLAMFVAGTSAAVASAWVVPAGLLAGAVGMFGPPGLGVRGRTSRLAWTPRLRRLAGAAGVLALVVTVAAAVVAGALSGRASAAVHGAASALALLAVLAPALLDVAMWLVRPLEARLLRPFVQKAAARLRSLSPRIVAITGSYGKTTTKGYVAHLLSGQWSVVATPASFNNTAGLARAVNEHLAPGTQVFVAEMGTYGPGEIAAMCAWACPEVSVITAIGPVHLERMRSLERIAEAKAEIFERASTAVVNVDYPLLDQLAGKLEAEGKTVWRCSSEAGRGDVSVTRYGDELRVRAAHFEREVDVLVAAAPETEPGNVACAVAAALSLGATPEQVAARLATLPGAPHRRAPQQGSGGFTVIDDTYNSNPAGASAALELLGRVAAAEGRRALVTPGMVELGPVQARENARFAAQAGDVATEMVVVGLTNAAALLAGARAAGLPARRARDRQAAVAWVSANLGKGDAVLYENDLPDHYP